MNLVPIPGNVPLLEKTVPNEKMTSSLGGPAGSGADFDASLRQSRDAMAGGTAAGEKDRRSPADNGNLHGSGTKNTSRVKVEQDKPQQVKTKLSADSPFKGSEKLRSSSGLKNKDAETKIPVAVEADDDITGRSPAGDLAVTSAASQNMVPLIVPVVAESTTNSTGHFPPMTAGGGESPTSAGNDGTKETFQSAPLSVDTHDLSFTPLTDELENSLLREPAGRSTGSGAEPAGFQLVSEKIGGLAVPGLPAMETSEIPSPVVNDGQSQGQPGGIGAAESLTNGRGSSAMVSLSVEAAGVNSSDQQLVASGDDQAGSFSAVEARAAAGMQLDYGSLKQSKRMEMTNVSTPTVHDLKEPAVTIPLAGESAGRHPAGQKGQQVPVHATIEPHVTAGEEKVLFAEVIEKTEVNTSLGRQQFVSVAQGMEQLSSGSVEKSVPVTSNDILNQVTMHMPDRHDSRQAVTIQLQPESLGKVEVKLVMEHQKLTAHFMVQHSEVRDVLLKQVTTLHDALVAKGIDVKQVAVEVAPAEKAPGMAVTVDQHAANGNQAGGFQQFSGGGGEQGAHAFAGRGQDSVPLLGAEEAHAPAGLPKSGVLQPGSLHIQA